MLGYIFEGGGWEMPRKPFVQFVISMNFMKVALACYRCWILVMWSCGSDVGLITPMLLEANSSSRKHKAYNYGTHKLYCSLFINTEMV